MKCFISYGRKRALLTSTVLYIVSNVSLTFVTNFWVFTTLRFFSGISVGGLISTAYVMGIYTCTYSYRQKFRISKEYSYQFEWHSSQTDEISKPFLHVHVSLNLISFNRFGVGWTRYEDVSWDGVHAVLGVRRAAVGRGSVFHPRLEISQSHIGTTHRPLPVLSLVQGGYLS